MSHLSHSLVIMVIQPFDLEWMAVGICNQHGPLTRCVQLRVAHAPGMPRTFSPPPPRVSNSDMHHGTCVRHVPQCMPGSLTSAFLWNRWRGKQSRHSRCMRNPQFYASGKRPMALTYSSLLFMVTMPRRPLSGIPHYVNTMASDITDNSTMCSKLCSGYH